MPQELVTELAPPPKRDKEQDDDGESDRCQRLRDCYFDCNGEPLDGQELDGWPEVRKCRRMRRVMK